MKDWFDTLESREQAFVSAGAVVVVITILYVFIWQPIAKVRKDLRVDVENLQQSLADLKPLAASLGNGAQPNGRAAPNTQSPIIVVDQTLRQHELDRYRRSSQPTTSNGIKVVFENVSFDELVVWLGDLGDQYSMHVQAGSFASGSQTSIGRINASLTLERAN